MRLPTLLFVLFSTGCTTQTLTSPAPVVPTTPLTIYTRWYAVHPDKPVAGVTVRIDNVVVGQTDSEGQLEVLAPTGHEIMVAVEKAPYVAMVPWVASQLLPNSHERWTFFLDLP